MKLGSVSGILLVVEKLEETISFYEALGFLFKEKTPDYAKAYLNWFWIEFVPFEKVEKSLFQKVTDAEKTDNKGAGLFVHVSVVGVDEYYQSILKKGLKPSSEPRDFPWRRREFVIRDPDGYKLVFFQKIK